MQQYEYANFRTGPKMHSELQSERHVSPSNAYVLHGCRFTKIAFGANFRRHGASPTNHCWCQKTRLIAISCGIKISAVHYTM